MNRRITQTARKSTGGIAPRNQLATKYNKKTVETIGSDDDDSTKTSVESEKQKTTIPKDLEASNCNKKVNNLNDDVIIISNLLI
jgi:hypothetical protein